MPRVCTVCSSPNRAAIDEALTSGEPNRRIAARVGCAESSIRRHLEKHLPGAIVKAHEAREVARADDLLELLREGVKDARRLRQKAEKERDYRCAVAAVKTMSDIVEKLAAVAERLGRSPEGNDPSTLAGLVRKVSVEYVNDWREGGGPVRPAAAAAALLEADDESPEPIPARLVS
ncbi:MAG TPA: hypothetical protein PLL76_22100 [Thermoanaerobaculia bacterium]|nr:hypothetical protein [Thermoanaerobaculia bacterium]